MGSEGTESIRRLGRTAAVQARVLAARSLPFWPKLLLDELQRRQVRAMVAHAYTSVPFYRQVMSESGLRPDDFHDAADLAQLPLLDSATVEANIDQFVSERYDEDSRIQVYTGGSSTGVRKRIYWGHDSMADGIATAERVAAVVETLAGERAGARLLRLAVGETRAEALRKKVNRERRSLIVFREDGSRRDVIARQVLMPRRPVHQHHLSPVVAFDEAVATINRVRPRVAYSFGSYADHFFRWLAEDGRPVALPKVWAYMGEGMSQAGRELAEGRFGCAVQSNYHVTEMGRVGFQCELRGAHHLNSDLVPIRIVDAAGSPTPVGESGEIVASNLHNRATVLLNFRLGDRGALSSRPCECGRKLELLDRLDGRVGDLLTLANGQQIVYRDLESLVHRELAGARKIQVAHPRPGEIRWRVVLPPGVDRTAYERVLLERCRSLLGEDNRLTLDVVDDIPPTPNGKFHVVVRDRDRG